MKVFARSLFSLILMFIILGIGIWSVSKVIYKSQILTTVEVGVVISKEDNLSKMATRYIANMNSVKSICHFQYVNKDEALVKLKAGQLEAVLVLPEHFYEDIERGENTPATVYFPSNTRLEGQIFGQLLKTGVQFLQIAEAGVYASYDTAVRFSDEVQREDIGDYIAWQYAKCVLNREKLFKEQIISPFGELEKEQYYFVSFLIIVLLMSCLNDGYLYQHQSKLVEQKLTVEGLGKWQLAWIKIAMITHQLWLISIVIYLVSWCIGEFKAWYWMQLPISMILGMLPVCLVIAIYTHLILEIIGSNVQGLSILFILNSMMIMSSGLVIPTAYLPKYLVKVSSYLPIKLWYQYCLKLIVEEGIRSELIGIGIMSVIGLGIGAVATWKST